jgi:hypothetical protein
MDLDELKAKWAEYDRKLETSIRLNRQLLRETYTRRAKYALWRLATTLAAGSVLLLTVIVSLGAFIYQNSGMPQFVWPAIILDVFAIAALACLNRQIALALRIDYSEPVSTIQKRLEGLRKLRIRYSQAICLTMALTWVPIFIVLMKAFLGVDVWRTFDRTWIVVNLLFGIAMIPAGLWFARKYGPRMGQKFLNDIAGYNLNAASGFLAELARFEDERSEN